MKKKKQRNLNFKGSQLTDEAKNPIFIAIIFSGEYKYCLEAKNCLGA
jgi:hypothetical protein